MPTVDKKIADKIIAGNGYYHPEDPIVTEIIEYDNAWGGQGYGITYPGQNPMTYHQESEFIRRPRIYWQLK